MQLVAVGRLRDGPEALLYQRYVARLRPALALTEIAEQAGNSAEAKRRENAALRNALPARGLVVALDPGGEALDSPGFAAALQNWRERHGGVCFVIGGAEGLDAETLARAGAAFSLGSLTWPHLLARVMLAEQLYRAQAILAGHPYHRAGRPA